MDVAAAEKRGIPVSNMPDYCVEEVADHAVILALGLIRKILQSNADVKKKAIGIGQGLGLSMRCEIASWGSSA